MTSPADFRIIRLAFAFREGIICRSLPNVVSLQSSSTNSQLMSSPEKSMDSGNSLALVIELLQSQANQISRIEDQLAILQELLARSSVSNVGGPVRRADVVDERDSVDLLQRFKQALNDRDWDRANLVRIKLVQLGASESEISFYDLLSSDARSNCRVDASKRLELAKGFRDLSTALAVRDELSLLVSQDELMSLDAQMIEWIMIELQKKLRAVPIGEDLIGLIQLVVDRYAATSQGASLKAALPTLRRSVGLCASCNKPYRGAEAACPECLRHPERSSFDDLDEIDRIVEASRPDLASDEVWPLLDDRNLDAT